MKCNSYNDNEQLCRDLYESLEYPKRHGFGKLLNGDYAND